MLALAPLGRKGDVSFILDKKKVDNAPERMRVEAARYIGTDDKGQRFTVSANNAIQRSSDVPIVDINGMFAQLAPAQGPLTIAANQGRYDLDSQKVAISGPVRVVGPDGYRLATSDVTVDMKQRKLRQRRSGVGPDAARPVPGGAAQRRPWQQDRRARRRGSLENRARGGQMMGVRSPGIILAGCVGAAVVGRRSARSSSNRAYPRSRGTTAMRRSTSPPTGSKCKTAPTARSSAATSTRRRANWRSTRNG